jgi:hypothetical protein
MNGLVSDLYRGRRPWAARDLTHPGERSSRKMIDASYNGARQTINLGNSFLQLPATRLDFTGR